MTTWLRRLRFLAPLLAGALLWASPARADGPAVGAPAPDFSGTDAQGKTQKLSQYKGRWVVLEWVNHGCPFVQKHYGSQNMQTLQKRYTEKGVVWLSVNSSAAGKQGYETPAEANRTLKEKGAHPTALILDPKGSIGRTYGAKTTPHMFVIDPQGTLVYAGAIDDKPSTDVADVKTAKNYVSQVLDDALAGKKPTVAATKSYGCGVKYE